MSFNVSETWRSGWTAVRERQRIRAGMMEKGIDASKGSRAPDICIFSATLYQLSYQGVGFNSCLLQP